MTDEFKKQLQAMLDEDLANELDEADRREADGETLPMSDEMKAIIGQDEQMSDIYERLAAESDNKKRVKFDIGEGVSVEFVPKGEKPEGEEDEKEDDWTPPKKTY